VRGGLASATTPFPFSNLSPHFKRTPIPARSGFASACQHAPFGRLSARIGLSGLACQQCFGFASLSALGFSGRCFCALSGLRWDLMRDVGVFRGALLSGSAHSGANTCWRFLPHCSCFRGSWERWGLRALALVFAWSIDDALFSWLCWGLGAVGT
jgi:hypothetical protein